MTVMKWGGIIVAPLVSLYGLVEIFAASYTLALSFFASSTAFTLLAFAAHTSRIAWVNIAKTDKQLKELQVAYRRDIVNQLALITDVSRREP